MTIIILNIFFSFNVKAEDLKKLFLDTLNSCIDAGWIECNKRFYGQNRGGFMLPIETEKTKLIKQAYYRYIKKYYDKDCDKSGLVRASLDGNVKLTINAEKFLSDIINITKDNNEAIHYELGNGAKIGLLPLNGKYLIAINKILERDFRKTKEYQYALFSRVSNNIHVYHMAEARKKSFSCDQFITSMNEALSPLAYQIDKNEKNRAIYKTFIRRDLNQIVNYYYPLNSNEMIRKALVQ